MSASNPASDLLTFNAMPDIAATLRARSEKIVQRWTEKLNSANAAESKYLSFLSHDLRNNIGGSTLILQLLSEKLAASPEFEQDAADLRSLQQSIAYTIEGMDRLLQAERLRKDAVLLKLAPVKLRPLASELIGHVTATARDKGLRVENLVPPAAA